MAPRPRPDETVDALGYMCPVPIVMLAERVREVEGGKVVELLADDPAAKEDVPAWCRRTGNDYLGMGADGDRLTFWIKKA
ncbi:MAG: sulfurtransferase TusA family protein [Halobacteria archaeon]